MTGLHGQTILFVSSLIYLLLAGALTVLAGALRRHRGPGYWAVGALGWAVFSQVRVLEGGLPAWLTIVVGNTGLILSLCLVVHGLTLFVGVPSRLRWHLGMCLAAALGLAYFSLVQESFVARVTIFSLAGVILGAEIALLVLRNRVTGPSAARHFVLATGTITVAFHAARLVAIVRTPPSGLFASQGPATVTLLLFPILGVALMLSLVALAGARFAADLEAERARLAEVNVDLRAALEHVRVLSGLLRVCAWCKKVKDEEQGWVPLDLYVQRHSDTAFTHGICPECLPAAMSGTDPPKPG